MAIVTPAIRKIYKDLIKQVVEDLHKPIFVFLPPEKVDCPNCFVAGQMVNTPFGYKPIESVVAGDLVFDAEGVVRRVSRTGSRRVHTPITKVSVWGNGAGLEGTSEHKVYAYVNLGSVYNPVLGVREDKSLSSLSAGDLVSYPIIDLPKDPLKFIEPKWRINKFGPKRELPAVIEVSDDFLYSYGLFLAEGCTSKGRQVQYCLNRSEVSWGERVCSYWKRELGINYAQHSRTSSIENAVFELYSSHLAGFFEDYAGHLAHNKFICPDLYYRLNPYQTMTLIRAIFDGDGHHEGSGRHSLTQTSKILAFQVHSLLLSCGYSATISINPAKLGKDGIQRRESYTVRYWESGVPRAYLQDGDRAYQAVKEVSTDCRVETVYNFEVEGSHTYTVAGLAVHNCIYDHINKRSSGKFDSSFTSSVEIFGNTITPISFSRSRCPVCFGAGHLENQRRRNVKALVKWNPTTAEDLEILPVGREGKAVVRIKILRTDFDLLKEAIYFEVDGVRCELIRPPTIRGLGTQEELVVAYLMEVEPGSEIKK